MQLRHEPIFLNLLLIALITNCTTRPVGETDLVSTDGDPNAVVIGSFPLSETLDLSTNFKNDFVVEQVSDKNLTNSCANYIDDSNTVFSRDNNLVLKVAAQCSGGECLHSGRVHSQKGFKYGVFEIEAAIPKCNQVFPALWLTPVTNKSFYGGKWPCIGEIDIMETTDVSTTGTATLVSGGGEDKDCKWLSTMAGDNGWYSSQTYIGEADCLNKNWPKQKYVLFWEPGRIIVFINPEIQKNSDGTVITKITASNSVSPADAKIKSYKAYTLKNTTTWQQAAAWAKQYYSSSATENAPFDQEMNLIFNIAIGGFQGACHWGNQCNAAPCVNAIGSEMVISAVRIYKVNS